MKEGWLGWGCVGVGQALHLLIRTSLLRGSYLRGQGAGAGAGTGLRAAWRRLGLQDWRHEI
jgi:hypothetical protein